MKNEFTINDYYKLKKRYDGQLDKKKSNIIKDTKSSKSDKQLMFELFKKDMVCINCKQKGGTEFKSDDSFLTIKCSAAKKCNLDIKIKRKKTTNIINLLKEITSKMSFLKESIVKIKLDLFFKYIEEDSAIKQFNEIKEKLSEVTSNFNDISLKLNELTNKADYSNLKQEIESEILTFNQMIRSNDNENDIKTSIQFYITTITPLTEQLRKLKYKYSFIERERDKKGKEVSEYTFGTKSFLKQSSNLLQDFEYEI